MSEADLRAIRETSVLPIVILRVGYLYQLKFQSELEEVTLKESGIRTKRATVEDVPSGRSYVLLNAHYAFEREIMKYAPLTGQTFQIINLGSVPTKGSQKVYQYSIKPM